MMRQARGAVDLGGYLVLLDGKRVTYTLRRSLRARHARLEVGRDTGLAVIIPHSYDAGQVSRLLREKKRWVLEKLAAIERMGRASAAESPGQPDTILYLGREMSVVRRASRNGCDGVRLDGNELAVMAKAGDGHVALLIEAWYRVQAARVLRDRMMEIGARMGVTPRRVSIRGQKTRWGSCSGRGNLSFNWKLLMAPPAVIDYVVVHELAHLREMNHSRRFWQLVGEYCPEWRIHKRWLRDHETELSDHFR